MDSLKFHPGPPCPTLLHPETALWPLQVSGGFGWPVAVFYPFGHPTSYAYDRHGGAGVVEKGHDGRIWRLLGGKSCRLSTADGCKNWFLFDIGPVVTKDLFQGYPWTPCPTLLHHYGHFRGGCPQCRNLTGILLLPWIPYAVHPWL
jgi:hypothetical protein